MRVLGPQNLERYLAAQPDVARLEDAAHGAFAQQPLKLVVAQDLPFMGFLIAPHRVTWGGHARKHGLCEKIVAAPPSRRGGGESGEGGSGQNGADEAEDAARGLTPSG